MSLTDFIKGGGAVVGTVITQAMISANQNIHVTLPVVANAVMAMIEGGAAVNELVVVDGINAYAVVSMTDGQNPTPFKDGDVLLIAPVVNSALPVVGGTPGGGAQ